MAASQCFPSSTTCLALVRIAFAPSDRSLCARSVPSFSDRVWQVERGREEREEGNLALALRLSISHPSREKTAPWTVSAGGGGGGGGDEQLALSVPQSIYQQSIESNNQSS